jgi:hypothetical protein
MKHIKLFEEFGLTEFLGIGHDDSHIKQKFNTYAHSSAWAAKPFYLYLGDGNFVKLSKASEDDKKKAYEVIKKEGEGDKWKGEIGIYGGHDVGKNEFLCYKPDAAVRRGDSGEEGLLSAGGPYEGDPKAFAAVGEPIMAEFKKFLEKQTVAK